MTLLNREQSPAIPISNPELKRVLVMQLGDTSAMVMLSPALRTLRHALPDAELTLMTSSAASRLTPLLPWVDNVIVDHAIGLNGSSHRSINPRDDIAFVENLSRHNFSIVFIFTSVAQSAVRAAYACYLAGIPYRVGFASGMSGSVLSHWSLPPAGEVHQVDRNINLLKAFGISGADQRMELDIPLDIEHRTGDLLGSIGVKPTIPYIVLAPGSMSALNTYDPNHFAVVAHLLAAQTEQQILIVGSLEETKNIQPILQVAR
jgi:ADP-heptose:LPS heptosyltransferase